MYRYTFVFCKAEHKVISFLSEPLRFLRVGLGVASAVEGLVCRVWGLGFKVQGVGSGALGPKP